MGTPPPLSAAYWPSAGSACHCYQELGESLAAPLAWLAVQASRAQGRHSGPGPPELLWEGGSGRQPVSLRTLCPSWGACEVGRKWLLLWVGCLTGRHPSGSCPGVLVTEALDGARDTAVDLGFVQLLRGNRVQGTSGRQGSRQ